MRQELDLLAGCGVVIDENPTLIVFSAKTGHPQDFFFYLLASS
jgi:hypothetical protein